jgi:hypothetical protein
MLYYQYLALLYICGLYSYNIVIYVLFFVNLQSYGIKVGYGGIPGPSGGAGSSSQAGGCCG